jgi:BirA family transcriptional regulator, biotin operon repressor / biotin---[acetyl-CoA-carboxylase] ligase
MPFNPRTVLIGRPLVELRSAESTNRSAAELLARGEVRHGAAILAHEQTAGQGQRGRSWLSTPEQDLTFSLVLQPRQLRADRQFALSMLTALAVHDVVQETVQAQVRIKWPNDILVERRKIAGVLIQNELVGEHLSSVIVGVGLNVNSTGFPEELQATSLYLECGHALDRMRLLERLCERFEHHWEAFLAGDDLSAPYASNLWARGRWAEMLLDGESIIARPMDVDGSGRLILEREDGRVETFGLERVRFGPR